MRVYRGRAATVEADRAATARAVERVAGGDVAAANDRDGPDPPDRDPPDREPAVRVWTPHRQVAFGRRDAAADGYDRARAAARDRGFPPVEREVGGRAVAYAGSTVAFVRVTPVADPRTGLHERYDAAVAALRSALDALGVDASEGEPPDSFCPGSHSLQATGPDERAGKLAGIAQRVRSDVAVVAGVLLVRDRDAVADVLDPVYAALDVPFDPETVGSVAFAGGEADAATVVTAVEDALVGAQPVRVERVAETA